MVGFVVATVFVLWRQRKHALWFLLGAWLIGLVWLFTLSPSNNRDWRPEVGRTASAEFDGDRVTVRNIRNFKYRTADDFDVRYTEKTYDLTALDSMDLLMCYWDGNTRIAHTMLSFGFGGKDYICLSSQIRREKGEEWGAVRGIYNQFEINYILAEELDLINLRTGYRNEDLYLFPMTLPKVDIRRYFEHVLRRINTLNEKPDFYNTLEYNCTSSLTRMGKELWPDRPRDTFLTHVTGLASLLNGGTDEHAYARGQISNHLPFAELKAKSYITPIGQEHRDAPDFSQKIRSALP